MSAWRRKSLELLPELKFLIETSTSPMAMWIDLHLEFDDAMKNNQTEFAERFLQLAAWCISEKAGPLPNHTSTAAALAFYEHLPEKAEYWQHLPKWFSKHQFNELLPIFSYHLSSKKLEHLKRNYAEAT